MGKEGTVGDTGMRGLGKCKAKETAMSESRQA